MTLKKTIKTVNSQTQIENTSEGFYYNILIVWIFVMKYFVLVITNSISYGFYYKILIVVTFAIKYFVLVITKIYETSENIR